MANATIRDSASTNPGGTGSTITVTLPTHAAGDILLIGIGNTGNTLWTGNPAGWTRIQQLQVGTSANGLLGTFFYRRVLSGDSLPLANPVFTLGATVSRLALSYSIDGASEEGIFSLFAWLRGTATGTSNPVRPASVTTSVPEALALHFYFSRGATNAPEPSGYTQDEEVVISGTLAGNASSKTVDDQATVLSNQDASPTSGVRWVAGIIVVPSDDYPLYRSASQATATGTSVTPALPAGTTATDVLGNKDLLIATVEGAGSTALSMTDGAWTEIATWDTTTSGGGSTVSKFWAYMSGTLNRQANRTGSGEISAQICTFYNCKQTSPIGNVNVRQNASSTTSAWDALTRSSTKTIVQSTCIADGVPTFTSPSGWNERTDGLGISTGDQVFNASGSAASASFTLSSASPTAVGLVEIVGLASVTEHTRSALVDATSLVSSSASFFSVTSRSASLDTAAGISVSGVREVSRSAAISVTGDISSSGTVSTPATTFERSASIDCSAEIESAGESFSVLERSVAIGFTGNIDASAVFFSVIQGSSLIDVTGSIESSSLFFSELSASAAVGVLGSIESVAEFFSILEISVAIDGNAQVSSSGIHISERAASLSASAEVVAAGQFFSVFERSITLTCVSGIDIAGSSFSILETSASVDGLVEILSSGSVQSDVTEFERTAQLGAIGSINAIGVAASVTFNPTRLVSVARENRTQPVGTEYRG